MGQSEEKISRKDLEDLMIHFDKEGRIVRANGEYVYDWTRGSIFSNPLRGRSTELFPTPRIGSGYQGEPESVLSKPPGCT